MRIFQSLWTKPALDKRWDQSNQLESNIWLYTLSVLYAKSIGVEIVLYTDSLGKQFLGHLPYDAIYTTLNDIPNSIPTMVWAYGKFHALKDEPIGSIHIDGDVLLKRKGLLKELDMTGYDFIVQNAEHAGGLYLDTEDLMMKYGALEKNVLTTSYAYNCGVIGFNNSELKKKYLDFYFKHVESIVANRKLKTIMLKDKYFCVDLPLEQHSIANIGKSYKAKILLKNDINSINKVASDIGYHHLIGKEKYSLIDRVKNYVLILNKDIYYKTKQTIEKYKNIIN